MLHRSTPCRLPVLLVKQSATRSQGAALRVLAAQTGRGGRIPATHHAHFHALAEQLSTPTLLADVCAAWRGSTPALSGWLQRGADVAAQSFRLLVTSRETALSDAYELEVAAASPRAVRVCDGVYVADAAPAAKLARMVSLRCELEPLAVAQTPVELVQRVAELRWSADTRLDGLCWELHHERRYNGGDAHVPSPQLREMLRAACGRPCLLTSRGAAAADALRLVVLETLAGCVFGVITYAPASSAATDAAWTRKPHNYCAGMPLNLACLGVNLATGLHPQGAVVADPCCGSGTVLFAAACLGAASVAGVELQRAVAAQCRTNLAATRDVAAAELRRIAAESQGRDALPGVEVLSADSLQVAFGSDGCRAVLRLSGDGGSVLPPLNCMVSNLPFGRWVGVGGKQAHTPLAETHADGLPRLLAWLRPQAERHAYFSAAPVAELLVDLGFSNVREVCVDPTRKRFLALASSA